MSTFVTDPKKVGDGPLTTEANQTIHDVLAGTATPAEAKELAKKLEEAAKTKQRLANITAGATLGLTGVGAVGEVTVGVAEGGLAATAAALGNSPEAIAAALNSPTAKIAGTVLGAIVDELANPAAALRVGDNLQALADKLNQIADQEEGIAAAINARNAAVIEHIEALARIRELPPKAENGKFFDPVNAPLGTDAFNPNGIDQDLGGYWTKERLAAYNKKVRESADGADHVGSASGKGSNGWSRDPKNNPGSTEPRDPAPIVLDLAGDGISIYEISSSNLFFDAAGDGYKHRTAWAGVGDGVLAIDADSDGQITERKEIVFTDWDPSAKTDMEALRSVFDTNNDGKLDAGDAEFSKFRVVVTNADGTTSVKTLVELGITSINLIADATKIALHDGSSIDGMTTYTKSDGSTGKAATVSFATDAQGYAIQNSVVHNADGSTTVTNVGRDANGGVANVTVTTTIADGNNRTITFEEETGSEWTNACRHMRDR